jgi:hypothetical protein
MLDIWTYMNEAANHYTVQRERRYISHKSKITPNDIYALVLRGHLCIGIHRHIVCIQGADRICAVTTCRRSTYPCTFCLDLAYTELLSASIVFTY